MAFRIPILDCEICNCQPEQHMSQRTKRIWLECPTCHAKCKSSPMLQDHYKSWLKPIVSWNDMQSSIKEQKQIDKPEKKDISFFFNDRRGA